jgi:hypothetical protein
LLPGPVFPHIFSLGGSTFTTGQKFFAPAGCMYTQSVEAEMQLEFDTYARIYGLNVTQFGTGAGGKNTLSQQGDFYLRKNGARGRLHLPIGAGVTPGNLAAAENLDDFVQPGDKVCVEWSFGGTGSVSVFAGSLMIQELLPWGERSGNSYQGLASNSTIPMIPYTAIGYGPVIASGNAGDQTGDARWQCDFHYVTEIMNEQGYTTQNNLMGGGWESPIRKNGADGHMRLVVPPNMLGFGKAYGASDIAMPGDLMDFRGYANGAISGSYGASIGCEHTLSRARKFGTWVSGTLGPGLKRYIPLEGETSFANAANAAGEGKFYAGLFVPTLFAFLDALVHANSLNGVTHVTFRDTGTATTLVVDIPAGGTDPYPHLYTDTTHQVLCGKLSGSYPTIEIDTTPSTGTGTIGPMIVSAAGLSMA